MPSAPDDEAWLDFESDPTLVDKHGLATFTGLTLNQIDAALKDGLPIQGKWRKGAPIQFSVPVVVRWLLDQHNDPLADAKRRQAVAIADKREAEAKKISGTMVELATVTAAIRDNMAKHQSELQGIAAKCPPEVRDLVRAEVNAAINRLAAGIQR